MALEAGIEALKKSGAGHGGWAAGAIGVRPDRAAEKLREATPKIASVYAILRCCSKTRLFLALKASLDTSDSVRTRVFSRRIISHMLF